MNSKANRPNLLEQLKEKKIPGLSVRFNGLSLLAPEFIPGWTRNEAIDPSESTTRQINFLQEIT